MDQPGFKKRLFPTFLEKSRGHFEGSDFKPFVILARVPDDFKVVFDRLFSDIWKGPKLVKNGPGAAPPDRHHPPDRPPSPGLSAGVEYPGNWARPKPGAGQTKAWRKPDQTLAEVDFGRLTP